MDGTSGRVEHWGRWNIEAGENGGGGGGGEGVTLQSMLSGYGYAALSSIAWYS